MKDSWKWITILLLLLALPGLACQLVTGQEGQQEEATTEGSGQGQEEGAGAEGDAGDGEAAQEGGGEGAPAFSELGEVGAGLQQFNSYRIEMQIDVTETGDGSQSGSIDLSAQRVLDPPANRTTMSVSGDLSEDFPVGAELSFTEVEGRNYVVLPGFGCISGGEAEAAAPTEQFNDLLDTGQLVGEITDAEFVGEETVNGQSVYHYRFDENDLRESEGNLRELDGHLYVAKEERYVVRMVVDGVGDLDALGNELQGGGDVHLQYDVMDVGQPLVIEVPEECGSAGSEYPVMEGATDLSAFEGLTTYTVEASLEEVATFYQEEMAAAGYEMGSDPVTMEDLVMLSFTAPDRPDVSVTLNAEGGSVNVLITAEGG